MNNTIIVDHHKLFIYVDPGYLNSYHDVNILWHSSVYQNWHQHFTHGDEYFEYLLRNLGYMGQEMFIIWRIGQQEFALDANHDVVQTYNKMHVGFKVQVEWGISGVKRKWRCFMKRFDSTQSKFTHLFQIAITFVNFLQRRRMDLAYEVIGEQNPNRVALYGKDISSYKSKICLICVFKFFL
jgi:hypothetical protein